MPEMPQINKGEHFRVVVTTEYYRAVMYGVCVYCRRENEEGETRGFLAARVFPAEERDRRNWLQIIHDREHSLPTEIDPWMTIYDEVDRNVRRRWEQHRRQKRKNGEGVS